jgi:NitT/TauT family transport system permease protein
MIGGAEAQAQAVPRASRWRLARAREASTGVRGRRHGVLTELRGTLPLKWRIVLGLVGLAAVVLLWIFGANRLGPTIVPTPAATWDAFVKLWRDGVFLEDLWASVKRIGIGYSISIALGIAFGIGIGTFASAEAFFEPTFAFVRYIPATALTPLLLLSLGIDESPKVTLIVLGTVFFNIAMIADVVRGVPRELLNAACTLGAGRVTLLRRVILRHSVPGIIDVARVNLAAAWLMLVVAELLAAQEGLGYRILRAQRFRGVDTMFAILAVFGVIGLVSDLFLRWLRNAVAPWAKP